MYPNEYEKMDRLLTALEEYVSERVPSHAHLENFYEVWRREEGIGYTDWLDALQWVISEEAAMDFDTLYFGETDEPVKPWL